MKIHRGSIMKNIANFKAIYGGIAAIALLVCATIIVAEGAAGKKPTYEQKIEKIMVDYVTAIQNTENAYDKKMAPAIKAARTVRDGAITKAGQVLLTKLERAAKDSKRLGRTDDTKLAEEEIVDIKETVERAKAADPDRPEAGDKGEIALEGPPLASHVTFGNQAYLAIMGDYTFGRAQSICKRIGGRLVCIESVPEMLFLQKALPVRYTLWVGAADGRHRGRWCWLNGKAVNAGFWAKDNPRPPERRWASKIWRNIHAALTDRGMQSRDEDAKCRGFICEWVR
jgi:hypothetical protein